MTFLMEMWRQIHPLKMPSVVPMITSQISCCELFQWPSCPTNRNIAERHETGRTTLFICKADYLSWPGGDVFQERAVNEQQLGCASVKGTDAGLQQGSAEQDIILSYMSSRIREKTKTNSGNPGHMSSPPLAHLAKRRNSFLWPGLTGSRLGSERLLRYYSDLTLSSRMRPTVHVLSLATGRQHSHLQGADNHSLFSSDRCFVSTESAEWCEVRRVLYHLFRLPVCVWGVLSL